MSPCGRLDWRCQTPQRTSGEKPISDFDDVLERLLVDHDFRAVLAAQPDTALSGYHLSAEEREILLAQLSAEQGGQHQVEQRISKAGMAGLLDAGELGGHGHGGGGQDAYRVSKPINQAAPHMY